MSTQLMKILETLEKVTRNKWIQMSKYSGVTTLRRNPHGREKMN
jgi:hypothetical protein